MSESEQKLSSRITEDIKNAMRAKDKPALAAIKNLKAAIQKKEIDEQIQ